MVVADRKTQLKKNNPDNVCNYYKKIADATNVSRLISM